MGSRGLVGLLVFGWGSAWSGLAVFTNGYWGYVNNFVGRWSFKDETGVDVRPEGQEVNLGFLGTFGYAAQFMYQPESNTYLRATGGQPHLDANGQQLAPKTIVLLMQSATNYADAGGHAAVRVQTTGSGDAVVIRDGGSTQGTWRKDNRNGRTTLTDTNGQPMQLNRGQIWVISVPIGSSVSY